MDAQQQNALNTSPIPPRFCSQCGALTNPEDNELQAARFCEQCGKPQYSQPQSPPVGVAVVPSKSAFYRNFGVAAAIVVILGGASFGTTRLFVDKPVAKAEGSPGGTAAGGHAQTGAEAGAGANAEQPAESPVAPEMQTRLKELQDSLALKPNDKELILKNANALYDIASAYQAKNAVFLAKNMFAKAQTLYERYLKEFDPKNTAARVDYAYTLLTQGKADDAIAQTKKVLEFEPHHPIALFNLGVIYNRQGDVEQSRKWFNECIKAAPGSEAAKTAENLLKELPAKSGS